MRIINDIINKEVVNGEAMTIGKVVDIEIDTAANAIESLIIVKNKGR
ncbi:MAG: PRC-barrel domain-containing protein, partial [Methanosphaera sp.]|nr:PRC-barrel domain-containing protein [Methanosphaera sp.]